MTRREYGLACKTCQRGGPVETHEVGTLAWNPPIPFWRRRGAMVGLLGMFPALLLAALLLHLFGPTSKPLALYPLEVGTEWTYDHSSDKTITERVVRHEVLAGADCAVIEQRFDGKLVGVLYLTSRDGGYYIWGFDGQKVEPPIPLLRGVLKKGAEWECGAEGEGKVPPGAFRVDDLQANVSVPYRAHLTAVRVYWTTGPSRETTYYVRGIGPVMRIWYDAQQKRETGHMKLRDFTRGKPDE